MKQETDTQIFLSLVVALFIFSLYIVLYFNLYLGILSALYNAYNFKCSVNKASVQRKLVLKTGSRMQLMLQVCKYFAKVNLKVNPEGTQAKGITFT